MICCVMQLAALSWRNQLEDIGVSVVSHSMKSLRIGQLAYRGFRVRSLFEGGETRGLQSPGLAQSCGSDVNLGEPGGCDGSLFRGIREIQCQFSFGREIRQGVALSHFRT